MCTTCGDKKLTQFLVKTCHKHINPKKEKEQKPTDF